MGGSPERVLVQHSESMKLALKDLCPDCQGKVKEKLAERLNQVEVGGSSSPDATWVLLGILALAWGITRARPGGQGGAEEYLTAKAARQQERHEAAEKAVAATASFFRGG